MATQTHPQSHSQHRRRPSHPPLRRVNLIVWCRSSSVRLASDDGSHHRTDLGEAPDVVCVSKTHDPDYGLWVHGPGTSVTASAADAAVAVATDSKAAP